MNRYTNTFAALLLGCGMVWPALADDDPTVRDRVFLVVFQPGPAWVEGKPVTEQPLRAHGSYVLRNYAEGKVMEAGPFGDGSGGALIYRAPSREAVEALLAEDPAVVDRVMIPTVYPWTLREWDYYLSPAPQRAEGTFVPHRSNLGDPDEHDGVSLVRQRLEKRFDGDLAGEGRGEMLMVTTAVAGSAGYVAMERVSGTLAGRQGTFVLQHSASMRGGEPGWLTMTVVPDSGTGALTGLAGEMQVEVTENGYRYTFDYTLPATPSGD
jgi:uncharacterized protein YciI